MSHRTAKHKVVLTADQRQDLERITRQSTIGVGKKRLATILLLADADHPDGGLTDIQIASELEVSERQLERIRKRFALNGLDAALSRSTRRDAGVPKVFDGSAEARLVTLCCSEPPAGRDHWTLQLLCDELTRLQVVTSVCPETVRQCLKKTNCSLGRPNASASPRKTGHASSPRWKRSSTPTRPATTTGTR